MCWCPFRLNSLWQGWSSGLVHCPGRDATDPIWRVLASSDRISSWNPLKPQHSIPCWLSVQWEPCAYMHCFPVLSKKGSSNVCGWIFLCMAFLGLGESAFFHWELCLLVSVLVIAVDPAFISWHFSKFKTEFYCISFFLTSRLHFWNSPAVTIRIYWGPF